MCFTASDTFKSEKENLYSNYNNSLIRVNQFLFLNPCIANQQCDPKSIHKTESYLQYQNIKTIRQNVRLSLREIKQHKNS